MSKDNAIHASIHASDKTGMKDIDKGSPEAKKGATIGASFVKAVVSKIKPKSNAIHASIRDEDVENG